MQKRTALASGAIAAIVGLAFAGTAPPSIGQEALPWGPAQQPRMILPGQNPYDAPSDPPVHQYPGPGYGQQPVPYQAQPYPKAAQAPWAPPGPYQAGPYQGKPPPRYDDAYRGPNPGQGQGAGQGYGDGYAPPPPQPAYQQPHQPGYGPPPNGNGQYGADPQDQAPAPNPYAHEDRGTPSDGTFSMGEIRDAGHRFFGSISQGLGSVIEYAFRRQGRPNGYILGEDVGGAFIAGLRYGEGVLHTRDAGNFKVFWQGPSLGYDAGAEGSRVLVLVYNMRHPDQIYRRFGGVAGSAYVVGGVGLNYQANGSMVLAPIRSGVGLRLGANLGYLHYTRQPTWNPF